MYTKLDMINEMIVSTGARPLTETQATHPSYIKAELLLERVKVSVQALGLWFNTEVRTFEADTDGEIALPDNCISADPVDGNYNMTARGGRLYDLGEGTFEIGCDMDLKVVLEIDLEDSPVSALEYIRCRAIYEFYLNGDGTDPKLQSYRLARDMGWSVLYKEHLRNRQANIFSSAHNTVNRLRRGSRKRG